MANILIPETLDNRSIATASGAQTITVGNTSSTPTIDIPVLGHDIQTGVSVPEGSLIGITSVTAYPLGLRLVLDISTAVAGSYDILLISGGRNSGEFTSVIIAVITITGAAGNVTYTYPFDITASGKVLGTRDVSTTVPSNGQYLAWNTANAQWEPITPPTPVTSVTMAGDVSGNSGSNTVDKIKGVSISGTSPTNGQYLILVGGVWTPTTVTPVTVVTLAGDVSGNSNTNTVDKIKGVSVSGTAPTNGQILQLSGGIWTPSTISTGFTPKLMKVVTEADFTTIVAGPGGTYHLDWSNVAYNNFDLGVNVSGAADTTGKYRLILPNTDTISDGTVSDYSAFLISKLSGQDVSIRTASAADDARVLAGNTSGGFRPTAHLHTPNDYTRVVIYRQTTSLRYIAFVLRELQEASIMRTTGINALTYTSPAGTPMIWGVNFVGGGEDSFEIDGSSFQQFFCRGMNRKVQVSWGVNFTPSGSSVWTLDGWLQFSTTGEITNSRRLIASNTISSNGMTSTLVGVQNFEWNQSVNGSLAIHLYRTGQTGSFSSGFVTIKEIL